MTLEFLEKDGKVFSHIRKKWLVKKPEEVVRQQFVVLLVNHYGYALEQMLEEENLTGRGSAQARADIVIYRSVEDIQKNNNPLIVVECKAESVIITERDYLQGELYARIHNAPFFVTHNSLETKFWRVKKDKSPGYREEIEDIPAVNASDKEIENLFAKLKTFKQGEFREVLKACHNIIRNNEKLDPTLAFDEIAKILFMKVYAERNLKAQKHQNIFSLDWVETAERYNPDYLQDMFDKTKREFGKSQIFKSDEKIILSNTSIKAIVQRLEKYNLSETSVDTKGIAFENFLSDTFLRSSLGQFFTPRPIVDFMIDMLQPQEGQIACDPACGSGGFLIRFFQKVQAQIHESLNTEYLQKKSAIEHHATLSETEKNTQILALFEQLEKDSDITNPHSRLYHLAQHSIFGVDANDRAARTAKMNMIMHGDGHGGIYHHDGFVNVGEISDNKFDCILTNPPFGMKTTGDLLKAFQLPKSESITTQVLFLERCMNLLKEKGKVGVVLPNGLFNNPQEKYVREFAEDNGRILATVSLPRETFLSSGADINCSLLFWQKFSAAEKDNWDNVLQEQKNNVYAEQTEERNNIAQTLSAKLNPKDFENDESFKVANEKLKQQKKIAQKRLKELEVLVQQEGRSRAKKAFNYPIFMFDVDKVGINATGDLIADNDLPKVTTLYRQFIEQQTVYDDKLAIVQYSNLVRWDAKNYLYELQTNFPLVKLKDHIYEHNEKVKLFNYPEEYFCILGVTNREGVYLNLTQKGETFNQAYKKVRKEELVFNPYRVNVGSIGIIDDEFDGYYISPAYIVFGVKETILNDYVYLVLSSNWYNRFLRATTSGSVRQNLTFDLLGELEIPLPDIEVQTQIVERWLQLKQQQINLKNEIQQFKNHFSNQILL
ncbi:MAG: N-6 DNA methylase [Chitinophagales bacterium]|jgi:type I restriction enzyme M protein|nr:N-6 DNA methylase [Chitinophagales bacterium]